MLPLTPPPGMGLKILGEVKIDWKKGRGGEGDNNRAEPNVKRFNLKIY